jgi:hypothetical protein
MADGTLTLQPSGVWFAEVTSLKGANGQTIQVSAPSRTAVLAALSAAVTAAGGNLTNMTLIDYTKPGPYSGDTGVPGIFENPSGGRGPA